MTAAAAAGWGWTRWARGGRRRADGCAAAGCAAAGGGWMRRARGGRWRADGRAAVAAAGRAAAGVAGCMAAGREICSYTKPMIIQWESTLTRSSESWDESPGAPSNGEDEYERIQKFKC